MRQAVGSRCANFQLMHEVGDFKTTEKVINFALNMNGFLRLGSNIGMVHLIPFFLYLLRIFANPLKNKKMRLFK